MKIEQQRQLDTNNLDTVKAFLTLSVLLYHSILAWSAFGWHSFTVKPFSFFAYLADLLLKFHTPAFTFLSGYLFYFLRYEKGKYRNPAKDIAGRAKRLLLPYGVMLLWVIPFYMTVENGTWNTAFIKYILAVSPTQLWYLIMLFGVFAVFCLLSDRLCKYPVVNFAVFYVIYGVATVLALVIPDYFQCWTVMKSLLYFYFGYAVRQDVFHKQSKFAHNIYISVCVYCILIFLDYQYLLTAESLPVKVFSAMLDPIITMIGISGFVALFARLDGSFLTKTKLFRYIRRYNFTVYLFHQQLVYIPLIWFSDKLHPLLLGAICAGFALFGSLGISFILDRFSGTRAIFGFKTTTKEK